jgi:16S rRNA (adenine1518-N6/adenine1519-N6)-dimethyltransferase
MKINAKKSLGQNFISDRKILEKIANAADLTKADTVVEVGPGFGTLTAILAEKAQKVITVEKDHRLIEGLREKFPDSQRISIIESDILEISPDTLDIHEDAYKIVANIPYYITSHFIRSVFEKWPKPSVMVLTVQKEVAQRIIAHPPHMNLLALSVQLYADAKIITTIKRGSFHPVPTIDSAIIKIVPKKQLPEVSITDFFQLIKMGFSSPRKQLLNNLRIHKERAKAALEKIGISPTVRPEVLSLENWEHLFQEINRD